MLMELFEFVETKVSDLDPEFLVTLNEISHNLIVSLGENISGVSMNMVGVISHYVSSLSGMLIRILFTVMVTFFMSVDYEKITSFLL